MSHPLEKLVQEGRFEGPLAVAHTCPFCRNILQIRHKGRSGGGRGQGMRHGNIGRGLVIQHIKTEHANHSAVKAAYKNSKNA